MGNESQIRLITRCYRSIFLHKNQQHYASKFTKVRFLLFLVLLTSGISEVLAQSGTYSQTTPNLCAAFSSRAFTFSNTPMTTVGGNLRVRWAGCGSSATLRIYLNINGSSTQVVNRSGSIVSCSYRTDNYAISAQTINDAINSAGGMITGFTNVSDGCAAGVGCSGLSDPCVQITLSYDHSPTANFTGSNLSTCAGGLVSFTNTTTGPVDSYFWDFGEGATPATSTSAGPHQVTYSTEGDKDVKLIVTGVGLTDSIIRPAYVSINPAPASGIVGQAQESWHEVDNSSTFVASQMILDNMGNVYSANTRRIGNSDYLYLSKYSPGGSLLWNETMTGITLTSVVDIAIDANHIYIAANTAQNSGDYLMAKYNLAGNLDWFVTYNGTAGGADIAYGVDVDANGNAFICGSSVEDNQNMVTVKYNASGDQQHVNSYDGSLSTADVAYDIAIDANNDVYVFGTVRSTINHDYALIKYNNLGIRLWDELFLGIGGENYGYYMDLDGAGNAYVGGKSFNGTNFSFTYVKYSPAGTRLWSRDLHKGFGNDDLINRMEVDASGILYSIADVSGSFFTTAIGPTGNTLWSTNFGGIANTEANDIALDSRGSVVVVGRTHNGSSYDIATVRYDAAGNESWFALYDGCGNVDDVPAAVVVDQVGNAVISGHNVQGFVIQYSTLLPPLAQIAVNPTSSCPGDTAWFTDATSGVSLSSAWSFGAGASPSTATGEGPHAVVFAGSGAQTVRLIASNSAGADTTEITYMVNNVPTLSVAVDSVECSDPSPAVLTASGADSYVWSNGFEGNPLSTMVSVGTTTYSVTGTDANGCTATTSKDVDLEDPLILNPTVVDETEEAACDGSITLAPVGGNPPYFFSWSDGSFSQNLSGLCSGYFCVTAFDISGCEIVWCDSVRLASCDEPTAVNTTAISQTRADLNWDCDGSAYAYEVRGNVVGGTGFVNLSLPPGCRSPYRVRGLSSSTSYFWQVRKLCDAAGSSVSEWSEPDTFSTLCAKPAPISAVNVTANSARLTWSMVSGAGYRIRGRKAGGPWIELPVPNQNATFFDVAGLQSGSQYQFHVRTNCSDRQNSGYTPIANFTTVAAKNSRGGTSVFDVHANFEISVEPNPGSGRFHLNSNQAGLHQLRIFDLSGQLMHHEPLSMVSGKAQIDLSELSSGVYVVRVMNQGVEQQLKLVVR